MKLADPKYRMMAEAWCSKGNPYDLCPGGNRYATVDELANLFHLFFTCDVEDWPTATKWLYDHSPETIEVLRQQQQEQCRGYREDCDCFLPDLVGPKRCERDKAARRLSENSRAQQGAWRKAVLDRDGHACQECGKTGCRLIAHHIKSFMDFPDSRWDVGNGVTLCGGCHWKAHHASRV